MTTTALPTATTMSNARKIDAMICDMQDAERDERRKLVVETRNRKAGDFLRYPVEVLRDANGCVCISAEPFSVVVVGKGGKMHALIVALDSHTINGAIYSPRTAAARLAPHHLRTARDYAQRLADRAAASECYKGEGPFTVEVWDADSLALFQKRGAVHLEAFCAFIDSIKNAA